ncbi:neutral amino acid uniporter 4-like [Argopecten irradians]|uniref:neutral amino acid uniporter 4-like n=1 Tax=Argopecten irradians TaxID=31199 RepID=UPI003720D4BE
MLLLPCYIGIGFLELPYMVKLLGLWSGSIGQLLYGSLNILASLMLVDCANTLTKRTGERLHDFGRVAEISMAHGPSCLQSHAGKFRLSVNTSILINYGLFLPDLLSTMNLFVKDFLLQYVIINDVVSIVGISVLLLPVYLTRRIKLLSYLTTAGNIVLFGISIIAFQYICRDLPDTRTRLAFKSVNFVTFTSFVNDVMFSFDGISLILPVRARMANKKRFDGLNGVLGVALVFVTSFHIGCGFFGYLKFGELTQVNFILNLPGDQCITKSLKLLSFVTMYLSTGMVVYIVTGLVWGRLSTMVRDDGVVRNNGESVCRVLLLIFTGSFTILVPELEHLISLTGCFRPLYVTLVVPFVVKLLTLYGEEETALPVNKFKRKFTFLACVIILIFGIYSTISGIGVAVYTTLYHIEV